MDEDNQQKGSISLNDIVSFCGLLIGIITLLGNVSVLIKCVIAVLAFIILISIITKQNKISVGFTVILMVVCLLIWFQSGSDVPQIFPPTVETSSQTEQQQIGTIESTEIITEPPKPKETEQSMPKETDPPKPRETEPKIEINYDIYCVDIAGETAEFSISGETAGMEPQWSSSNPDVVKVSSDGKVTAVGEGDANINAEIRFDGKTYSEHIEVSIVQEAANKESYRFSYLQSVPKGINQDHRDYKELWNTYQIYDNEQKALSSIKHSYSACESGPNVIGYVYYHWCRGSYNDPAIILNDSGRAYPYNCNHNRLSEPERSVVQAYGESVNLDSFSCFFSDKYTNLSDLYAHDSGCYWFENSGVCNDSFWFWTVPVYETEYTGYDMQLKIIVNN